MKTYYLVARKQKLPSGKTIINVYVESRKNEHTILSFEARDYEEANKMMMFSVYHNGRSHIMQTFNNGVEYNVY